MAVRIPSDVRPNAKSATTLAEYHQIIAETVQLWRKNETRPRPWFRGQRSIDWELVPSAFRRHLTYAVEHEHMVEFKRRGRWLLPHQPQSLWEWLFIAQHYGLPTRLLDWSESAMAGLFFAVEDRPEYKDAATQSSDAGVWMLDPFWLNMESYGFRYVVTVKQNEATEYLQPYEKGEPCPDERKFPLAIIPDYTTPRILAQRATFTVFPEDELVLESMAAKERTDGSPLTLIRIPNTSIESMRAELDVAGITESVMYPDLVGLATEIGRRFVPAE